MALLQDPETPASAGYTAHNERSRATFLANGQDILETYGLNATTRQIQSVTGVSPSTLYRYFKSREAYLAESFFSIWTPWIKGFLEHASKFDDELIAMVFPIRMVLKMGRTNPKLAAIIGHKDFISDEVLLEMRRDWEIHFKSLVEAAVLPNDRTEAKVLIFTGSLMVLVKSAIKGLGSEEANAGLELALSTLGLSESQIEKVLKVPLPLD